MSWQASRIGWGRRASFVDWWNPSAGHYSLSLHSNPENRGWTVKREFSRFFLFLLDRARLAYADDGYGFGTVV